MKFLGVVLLCCVLLVKGQGPDDPTTTTPAAPKTTSPTTTAPTTTTKEPTTTTPPDTTTTPSTTTVKPTPTPTPTPSPVVPDYPKNIGKWSVENKDNSSCIALKGAMQIVINSDNKTETVNVPPHAVASGNCSGEQTITLTWDSLIPEKQNSLSLKFEENSTKANSLDAQSGITVGKYGLQDVEVTLYLNSTNSTEERIENIAKFQTPLNHSYSCLAEETIKSKDGKLTLKIREVQLEAYRFSPPGHREFSTAVQCPADDATDVVPIAVGAALAGLVVIVLIAYLIGRKRSRARGYQSV